MTSAKPSFPWPGRWLYWLLGLGSGFWLLLRSGGNLRRLQYPCQRAALANSLTFLAYLASLGGLLSLRRLFRPRSAMSGAAAFTLLLVLAGGLTGATPTAAPAAAGITGLPAWTSPTAISDVFVVESVPVPVCSLDGGTLPATAPCNSASYALADAGVDKLIGEMETRGDYFYKTASHPTGTVGANDVVVIKINNQWGEQGSGDGLGRLSTSSDVLKGLLWRIVQHPAGFIGEIVIAENTQGAHAGVWADNPANAEDQNQSYQDVVDVFAGLGYPVTVYSWDDLNDDLVSGGYVTDTTPTAGEYVNGNMNDAYILLEDPAGSGTDELAYPKFRTSLGTYISMRYGVWDGSSYTSDRLTFINLPVLKKHVMAGTTSAWKNYVGFVTIADHARRFNYGTGGDTWNSMHGFFWGWEGYGDVDYGGLGRQLARIRAADLNLVDAIWVANEANYYGAAVRQDVLLASTDPFAVDWYASEYVLRPAIPTWASPEDASAARGGIFRTATRTVQNVAQAVWPGGSYPYIDLLDAYDGATPSDTEKNEMNVYVVAGGTACQPITAVTINGPSLGELDTPYTFTTELTPLTASLPVTYTWDNADSTAASPRTFDSTGTYDLSVTVSNACSGPLSDTHAIRILTTLEKIYLPVVRR